MALHAGYVTLENGSDRPSGVLRGLGGRLHLYLGKHLRAGGAGAAVSLPYGQAEALGSYVRIGYGGLAAEVTFPLGKWRLSAGVLAGGGTFDNMQVIASGEHGRFDGIRDTRTTFILTPLLTVERSLTDAISVMLSADYLYGPGLGVRKQLGGPKLQLGILFNK